MAECRISLRWIGLGVVLMAVCSTGCFSARGIAEITTYPYPLLYEDDSTARFGTTDDSVLIEVRRTRAPGHLKNMAVRYMSLFPGGEIIRPGDGEAYVEVDGKTAYKVVFQPKYLRKRKRVRENFTSGRQEVPEGWTPARMEDPITGKTIRVLHGPVISQYRSLYLVRGDSELYYLFLRADGDQVEPARKRFEEFVRNGISYK